MTGRTEDPHKKYERRQAVWLVVAYGAIALMTAAIMAYAWFGAGARR